MPHDHAHHHERPRPERPTLSLVRWSALRRVLAAALLLAPLWAAILLVTR